MGARFLFIGTISLCLVHGSNCVQAQDAPEGSEVLPAIEVNPPTAGAKPVRGRNAPRAVTRNLRRVFVYPTAPTPIAGVGIAVDKVPASVNAIGAGQIARTGSLNIADALQQQVPGIIVSDVTGNPFQPDMVLLQPPSPALPRDLRFTRTECASTKRSATPSTGI